MLSDMLDALYDYLNATVLRQVLQEYSSRLEIDGASQVAVNDCQVAQGLLSWLQDGHRDLPYSVTMPARFAQEETVKRLQQISDVNTISPFPDNHFTHAIAQMNAYDAKIVLETLTQQFYALLPKGIAIMTFLDDEPISDIIAHIVHSSEQGQEPQPVKHQDSNTVAEQRLFDLSESAQFERGKTRWTKRVHIIEGRELNQLLQSVLDGRGKEREALNLNENQKEDVLDALKRHAQTAGGIAVEYWLMVAMKWDMLNG